MVRRVVILWAVASVAVAATGAASASAAELDVASGPVRATVTDAPWSIVVRQQGGPELREEQGLGLRSALGWRRAVRARALRRDGEAVVAEVEVTGGEVLSVRLSPAGDGVLALEVRAPRSAQATGTQFVAAPAERFYGSGERSDAVDRRGRETEAYVSDGPFREEDRPFVKTITPPWAQRERDDATYFPVPWLLSSRGWGVLVDEDVTSRFSAAVARDDRWDVDADGNRLRLRIFGGPTPAAALGRYTAAVGRQPPPQAPWTFGPWFQTGQPNVVPVEDERAIVKAQRDAGVPVSVAETQMHYLPCGAHKGREGAERERTDAFHGAGLARLVYFNPSLCSSYRAVYDRAAAAGVLQKGPGGAPFQYPAFVGGSGPAGFTQEPLAQFDWTNPATEDFYALFEGDQLPVWKRMTELHHQLNPYLRAADDEHRRSGLPTVRHMVLAHPESARAQDVDDQWLFGPDLLAAPVTAPGVRERSVWLPPGRWVDWWRSVRADSGDAIGLGALQVLAGDRDVVLPAPLGRPPLLARVGSVLPLLDGDVDTLSPYDGPGLAQLSERPDRLRLLALPRVSTLSRLPDGGHARSIELRDRWVLRVSGRRPTTYAVEASLRELQRPFRPRRVLVGGRRLPRSRWSYDAATGVLKVAARGARVRIEARRR